MLSHNIADLNVQHKDIVHQCLRLIHNLQMAMPRGYYSAYSKCETLTGSLDDLMETKEPEHAKWETNMLYPHK